MDIISQTGVPTKNKGDGLSSSDINRINNTTNLSAEASNLFLKSVFDVNLEMGTERTYTIEEAASLVPYGRRRIGIKVRFYSSGGFYDEQTYVGDTLESNEWLNRNNWSHGGTIIDGGEW